MRILAVPIAASEGPLVGGCNTETTVARPLSIGAKPPRRLTPNHGVPGAPVRSRPVLAGSSSLAENETPWRPTRFQSGSPPTIGISGSSTKSPMPLARCRTSISLCGFGTPSPRCSSPYLRRDRNIQRLLIEDDTELPGQPRDRCDHAQPFVEVVAQDRRPRR